MIKAIKTIVVAEDSSSEVVCVLTEENMLFSIAKMESDTLYGETTYYCITSFCANILKWRKIKKTLMTLDGVLAFTK